MTDERRGLPSASGMDILYACPGSQNLQAQVPKSDDIDDSPERQQGTEIAEAMESDDFTGLDEQGQTIAQRLKRMEEQAVADWTVQTGAKWDKMQTPVREVRFWVRDRKTLDPIASAKLDVCWISTPHAIAVDHKSGYIPVTAAAKNIQCRIQALSLWHEYPELTHIRVATAQQRFTGKFDATDYDVPLLQRAEHELLFNLWRAKDPLAQRVPGTHCRYCRAKGICPEAAAYSLLPAGMVPALTKEQIPALVSQLTVSQMAAVRQRKPLIEKIISAIDSRLRGLTPEELASVGLYLASSGDTKNVTDIQGAFAILNGKGLITDEEFRTCCKIVMGRVEELVVPRLKERSGLTDKASKAELDNLLNPVMAREPKLPSIRSRKE